MAEVNLSEAINPGQSRTVELPGHRPPPRHAPQPQHSKPPIAPEVRREDMMIEVLTPDEGLRLHEAEMGIKDRELYSRFRDFQAERRELFQAAFDSLRQSEPELNGYQFYRQFYRGLEVVSRLNPQLAELEISSKLERVLLIGPENARQIQRNIELLFRLGAVSLLGRTAAGTDSFLDHFLAVNFDRREKLESLASQLTDETRLCCLLTAADLVQQLYEKLLERIASAADQESLIQQAAAKRLAERKEEERQQERRVESRREEAARLVRQIADKSEADVLVRLGEGLRELQAEAEQSERTPLPADEFLENIVSGLDRLAWLGRVLESVPASEAKELLALAYRWERLDSRLVGLPERLRDHVKSCFGKMLEDINLTDSLLTNPSTQSALELLDTEQNRNYIAAGFDLLAARDKTEEPAAAPLYYPEDEVQPLPTLAAIGKFLISLQTAVEEENAEAFVPALLSAAAPERFPISFEGDLRNEQKLAIICQAFIAAGPQAVPLLLSAYRSAAVELSVLRPAARQAAREAMTHVILTLCLRHREALLGLLEYKAPDSPRQTERENEPEGVIKLSRARVARVPDIWPQLLNAMFRICNETERQDKVASHELQREEALTPTQRLKLETQRLAADNHSLVTVGNQDSIPNRKTILALAVSVSTVIELVATDKPLEALPELNKLLAAARTAGAKLSAAPALVDLVYAAIWEKAIRNDAQVASFCAGKTPGPGTTIDPQGRLGIIEEEISTISQDYQVTVGESLSERLLHGLVMSRVDDRPALADRIISLLKVDPVWDSLTELVISQPAAAAAVIDTCVREARKALNEESERKLHRPIETAIPIRVIELRPRPGPD